MVALNTVAAAPLAHAGPHEPGDALMHVLTEPDHLLLLLGAAAAQWAAAALYRYLSARRSRRRSS